MTSFPTQDDPLRVVSKIIAEIIVVFALVCLRAWLLSICMGWIFPGFMLGPWQWVVIAFTIRMFAWSTYKTDK